LVSHEVRTELHGIEKNRAFELCQGSIYLAPVLAARTLIRRSESSLSVGPAHRA
jgi:hypothetical protein